VSDGFVLVGPGDVDITWIPSRLYLTLELIESVDGVGSRSIQRMTAHAPTRISTDGLMFARTTTIYLAEYLYIIMYCFIQ